MPRVLITKTLGPNIIEGSLRMLSGRSIRNITAEHGDGWYMVADPHARRNMLRGTADAPAPQKRRRGRPRKDEQATT